MKTRTARLFLAGVIALPLLGYVWLSFGIFSDREFGTLYLFKKHRLSPRLYFYAPVGESDTPASALSPRAQRAEADFEEFVERGGGYYHKRRISQ
jgi:hypothetical protein